MGTAVYDIPISTVIAKTGLTKAYLRRVFDVREGYCCREELESWLEQKRAKEEQEAAAASRVAKMQEHGWQMSLVIDKKAGFAKPTMHNAAVILINSEEWREVLAYDAFSGTVALMKEPPAPDGVPHLMTKYPRAMETQDLEAIRMWFQSSIYRMDVDHKSITGAVNSAARRVTFHPVVEFLKGLEWDHESRIDTWLTKYLGVEDSAYARRVGRYWLMSAVARAREPGAQADHVLVLEGPQGAGKSTACRILSVDEEEWYLGQVRDIHNKETAMQLRGKWVVEFAELSGLRNAEVESIKDFFTTHTDKWVPKFENLETKAKRQCVFAATVNKDRYLRDSSGNRRFWPVRVAATIDTDALRRDVEQLWAEADVIYMARRICDACDESSNRCEEHRWWPSPEEQAALFTRQQEARLIEDPWRDVVMKYMRGLASTGKPETTQQILTGALQLSPGEITEADARRLENALQSVHMNSRTVEQNGARTVVWYLDPARCKETD